MKISKIIKSSGFIAILGFGTVFTASADDIADLLSHTDHIGPALVNTMAGDLLVAYSRNPSLGLNLICMTAVNYSAAIYHLSAPEYGDLLTDCVAMKEGDELPEIP